MAEGTTTVELVQLADYRFEASFGVPGMPALVTDEPPPLGGNTGPSPDHLLAAAVANCLASSLLFALRKFKNQPEPIRAVAVVEKARNADKRMRISRIAVDLHFGAASAGMQMLERALAQFEDFCVVTQSVRAGIAVDVRVFDADGTLLKQG
ncbi:MAG TPA: OsmC family protein [Burkholderiaceae bacterium]|jgi:organic hydroperoxide reductase OsmC/OhrA|nr:OsmC family protein [Burkholderiaceae bacterium]